MSEKRVRAVRVTHEFFTPLFRSDIGIVAGLPDDARCVRVNKEPARDTWLFIFRSKEFAPIKEGEKIPIHDKVTSIGIDTPRPEGFSTRETNGSL